MPPRRGTVQTKVDEAIRHHRANDFARAEKLYEQVLALEGDHLLALHLLAAIRLETGRYRSAIELLKRAIARDPRQAAFHSNLGEAHRRLGELGEATIHLGRAIALQPAQPQPHCALGLTLRALGEKARAAESFRHAIALKPDFGAAHDGLARALHSLGDFDGAREACSRAIALDAVSADRHHLMGVILKDAGLVDEAVASLRRAVEIDPDNAVTHSTLVHTMNYHPGQDPEALRREAIHWRQRHAASPAIDVRHPNDRDPERRLRIGYVSADFREHCALLFLIPLLEHHDRSTVEVLCYSSTSLSDAFTDRIRKLSDRFVDVADQNDATVSETIRNDRIDILVDLSMHTDGCRLRVFASKPAPVQVTWLAYPGTTGFDAIDYRISDIFLDPPGSASDAWYTEKSIRLPDTFWCYTPLTQGPTVGPLPASRHGYVTFGCLNSFIKTHAEVFALWARVLTAVPGSRMLLLAPRGEPRTRVRDVVARAHVDPDRVEFFDRTDRQTYLDAYNGIDVCLDTFPCGGHTTSLDAYWMGVPVVTLVGPTVMGRAGLSQATNLGLPELVAVTPEQYVRIAGDLCADLNALSRLRAGLRTRIQNSPLMDGSRFARNLEAAYRTMWRAWCGA
jgi:predicted O-linked N-acetylglucosamine transferase (SPINDLY family)